MLLLSHGNDIGDDSGDADADRGPRREKPPTIGLVRFSEGEMRLL